MKRYLALLTVCCLLTGALPAMAEETDGLYFEGWTKEIVEGYFKKGDIADELKDNGVYTSIGPQYHEADREEFNNSSPALYTAKLQANVSAYAERNIGSERVIRGGSSGVKVDVLSVGTFWCVVRNNGRIGYAKREKLSGFEPVAPNTMPYGVQKHSYVAKTAGITYVRVGMSHEDAYWAVLKPGTTLTIWKIQDGWAIVNYHRFYGYIDLNDLTDLVAVSPTDTPISDESPIAAYTSYYGMAQTESNLNRLLNIQLACGMLSTVLMPGETYNCNKTWGPYNAAKGYKNAPVLVDGETVPGYGGGTCQVSSTMYNALIQLPGIEIVNRRAHGPSGAAYLPHGVDAAVGDDGKSPPLNLIFKNNYDFPVKMVALSNNDGALCMLIYRITDAQAQAELAQKTASAE